MTIIYECEHGRVWKSNGNYGTLRAGHMLCVELAKEIERLRALVLAEGHRIAAAHDILARLAEKETDRAALLTPTTPEPGSV